MKFNNNEGTSLKRPFWQTWAACFALVLLVWAVFGQTVGHDFINCDDDLFVYQNPLVLQGLTPAAVYRVVTSTTDTFYYPLTVLSFMADAQLHGMNPAGFHLTNVLLHTASALLLFAFLFRLTGMKGRSFLVAALFAVHPLQVEAVAWVTGRKDVLSGLFFMLTLHAYLSYARRPFSWVRYLPVCLLFLPGLMAKPMLVTVPAVLLLLDYRPLGRLVKGVGRRVWIEKIPLLVLSAAISICTLMSSVAEKAGSGGADVPLAERVANAAVAYVLYIRAFLAPFGLAMPYPWQSVHPLQVAAATISLLSVSTAVFLLRRKNPYLLTGWFWYLGMLVPVSGMIRALGCARADRFTYLPQIGLSLAAVWMLSEWCITARRRVAAALVSLIVLGILVGVSHQQSSYWLNSETLWNRTLSCTVDNSMAHANLGVELFVTGRTEEAIEQFKKAIEHGAQHAEVWNNLGRAYAEQENHAQAVEYYLQALRQNPERMVIWKNLADSLLACGDTERAAALYRAIIEKQPESPDVLRKLQTIPSEESPAN